jgi:uncharacterized membrane protein
MSVAELRQAFPPEVLEAIERAVENAERNTSGEIKVKIIGNCDPDLGGDANAQAVREFEREGLGNTRDKTGVLLLLVFNERKFTVLGDSGIHAKLGQEYWDRAAREMSDYFRQGAFGLGIHAAVTDVGFRLAEFFPKRSDDVNELSDGVILGGGNA